jgi:DNA modification methylase
MTVRIINADVMDGLKGLPDDSVHCVVTSPPYFGLRDYGTGTWEGGDERCSHIEVQAQDRPGRTTPGGRGGSLPQTERAFKDVCGRCGAKRVDKQIGLEPTPAAFIARLVEVFREVRRVLRSDGTCWLNMGDSYAASTKGAGGVGKQHSNAGSVMADRSWAIPPGMKPKDLLLIPERLAIALQEDGWYIRARIIWAKPNPMPESVTDRPTKSHEHIWLMSKQPRYFYDAEAIKEPAEIRALSTWGDRRQHEPVRRGDPGQSNHVNRTASLASTEGRNARDVWTIATAPFAEAHFATFPPELAERCIKAGCPKDGTVLDPFGGAGTTGLVADRLQRNAILIELNPAYAAMAKRRVTNDCPLFTEAAE